MIKEGEPSGDPHPPPDLKGIGEDALIRRIREAASRPDPSLLKSIGDDCAVFAGAARTLVTSDLLVENVHFKTAFTPPRLLGRKAAAVNLSDIAAMGGTPRFALLGLSAPAEFSFAYLDRLIVGFIARLAESHTILIGGDTTRSGALILAVTVIGEAEPPAPVYRLGARPGDDLWVTGPLGGSSFGLDALLKMKPPVIEENIAAHPHAGAILAHLDPPARIEEGRRLAPLATAMMDLSDGMMTDLPRLLLESGGVGAVIEADSVPLSPELRGLGEGALDFALAGGEDYELVFTAPSGSRERIMGLGGFCRIGRIEAKPGIRVLDGQGGELPAPRPLFEHFPGSERP